MKRDKDIERLLRLYGSDVKGWRGPKLIATCPFAKWTHRKGSDANPSFAVLGYSDPYNYHCLACGEKGPIAGLSWRIAALGGRMVPEATSLAYADNEEEREKPAVTQIDYSPGGKFSSTGTVWRERVQGQLIPVRQTRRDEPHEPPDPKKVSLWVNAPVPKYVRVRGFSEVHREWGLGYDERSRRWVHLIRDEHGEVQGYTARTTWEKDHCFRCGEMIVKDGKRLHKCPGCGMGHMKYRHHPGSWRRDNLFGIERHVEGEPIVITEGTTDAMNLWRHGVRHPVAILGASLSGGQAQLIARRTGRVLVAGDGDMAGRNLNEESERVLSALGVSVVKISIPEGSDPGSLSASEVEDLFLGYSG